MYICSREHGGFLSAERENFKLVAGAGCFVRQKMCYPCVDGGWSWCTNIHVALFFSLLFLFSFFRRAWVLCIDSPTLLYVLISCAYLQQDGGRASPGRDRPCTSTTSTRSPRGTLRSWPRQWTPPGSMVVRTAVSKEKVRRILQAQKKRRGESGKCVTPRKVEKVVYSC